MSQLSARAAWGVLAFYPGITSSQEKYPDHPVRTIVPFSLSGGTDIQARAYAQVLRAKYAKVIKQAHIKL